MVARWCLEGYRSNYNRTRISTCHRCRVLRLRDRWTKTVPTIDPCSSFTFKATPEPRSTVSHSSESSSTGYPGIPNTPPTETTLVAFAPRSYSTGSQHASHRPKRRSYRTTFPHWKRQSFFTLHPKTRIILYGHSLGGAAAVLLLLRRELLSLEPRARIKALVLKDTLPSIPYMLRAIYPQRWLPYHHLGPCVFDRWDAIAQVDNITEGSEGLKGLKTLWFRSGRDELIPTEQEEKNEGENRVRRMYEEWKGEDKRWVDIKDALHKTAWLYRK